MSLRPKTIVLSILFVLMVSLVLPILAASTGNETTRDLITTPSLVEFRVGSVASLEDQRVLDTSSFVPLKEEDKLTIENSQFRLYMNQRTTAFKVQNKQTGYVWNSVIDDVDAGTYNGLLSSSFGIEYINIAQNHTLRQNIGLVDTLHTVQTTVHSDKVVLDILIDGFCTSRQCTQFLPQYIDGNPSYGLERMQTLGFVSLKTQVQVEVRLTGQGITVHVPFDKIQQGNASNVVLSSFMVFPGLGASFKDEIPGYMVLPDGVGALIRYQDRQDRFVAAYEERFYGVDQGIRSSRTSVTNQRLMMPIYGVVHGVNQHAMLAVIEQGDLSARLLALPAGANNVSYNVIFPKFDFYQTYLQSYTSDGQGGMLRVHPSSTSDILIHFEFLSGQEANYVGMGLRYQSRLVEQGVLQPLSTTVSDVPLHTQVIMADSRNQFIGTQLITMSTVEQTRFMVNELIASGIANQHLSLLGWNQGGYSGYLPSRLRFASALGGRSEFVSLFSEFRDLPIYLANNYVQASSDNSRIRYRRDVAMGVNRFRLETTCTSCVYASQYRLFPSASMQFATSDYADLTNLGVRFLMEDLAQGLFSYYQNESFRREDTLLQYQDIMSMYQGDAAYLTPNAYAWAYTDAFFDTPVSHSQLKIFDDTIPLLTVVLAGHMDLFSTHLNFNSIGRSQLLRLIDFHVYPSFVVSHERSSMLKGSDLESMYATGFTAWAPTVVSEYEFINEALQHVYGARLIGRERLMDNVVKTSYDNDVQIVINYGSTPIQYQGVVVEALSYRVLGVTR